MRFVEIPAILSTVPDLSCVAEVVLAANSPVFGQSVEGF